MKRLLTLLCAAASIPACASMSQPWSRADVAGQLLVTAAMVPDGLQSVAMARSPDRFWEINPILGRHPSEENVIWYFLTSAVAKAVITDCLPPKWRRWWQGACFGASAALVVHNHRIGVRP